MSDNNNHNNNNNNNQGGRSGFPPNLGGGVDHAMWAQAMAQQAQAKHNSGQAFNPAASSQLLNSFRQLQQNNGGNPNNLNQNQLQNHNQNQNNPGSAAQQANVMKALQEANSRNGRLPGGGQLQMPSGPGQVGIAGQHALLQALLANNQHGQQQQFPGGPPSFNPNQPQFSLQLPNQHQQQQQQQQQQNSNSQQQQQQQQQQNPQLNNGRQAANIPPAMVAILTNMGPQGMNMIKDWHQGNLSGEQMVQLKQLLAAHQSRQPKSTNVAQQQQSNQMVNQNSSHERNSSGSSQPPSQAQQQQRPDIAKMGNEQLGKVITSLTSKVKNLELSLTNGQVPDEQVDRAKTAMGEWTLQLRALVREAQSRNLPLVQNGNLPNIHSSPNPSFNQPNTHQNQFVNNGLPPNFNNSPNLQARPNPGTSFNAPVDAGQQRTSFFKKLSEMFQRKGITIQSSPTVEGRQIDLFDLYVKVVSEGGSENVKARNLWPVVGAHLGLASSSGPDGIPRSTPDTANQVADIFGTYLLSFEDAWRNAATESRLVNQSPQLGQQQQQQHQHQQQQSQQQQPPQAEINTVLEKISQMDQVQRDSLTLPPDLSRQLEIYMAQKNANLANNNGSSPQVQPGSVGGGQPNAATFAWARQQQQFAEATARGSGNQPSSSMGGGAVAGGVPPRPASGGVGQQPQDGGPRPFVAPTPEDTQKSKLVINHMIEQLVEKLRATQKEVEGLSDEEKNEITTALRDLQGQIGEAEKRLTLFRILSHTTETVAACNRVTQMIAMWKNASWNASQGRIILGRNEIMGLRTQIGRFIHYVHTTVQTLMNRPQQNDQQRQLQQQQFLQQQQLQAQQQLQQAAALQQQQQENQSQLATNLPDPSTFAGRLRPEDLRAPPPSKRARTSSVGGIASPSPAATTPAELRTPINAEQSPPANGKSPASSKKGTPKAAGNKKEKPSAGNRKSSTSGTGRSTLDQVKEELEKRDREEDVVEVPSQGPSVPTGVVATDPASVLGLQMDGWEERRRQEEVRAAAKDPVSFFQSQWNNLHQAQIDASNAGGVPNTFHDGGGGPNGLDHTALARAMRDIRQPSTYGSSSSSSYPIASTSSLPYNSLGYSSNSIQDSNRPASPKSPVEDFDISFFLDASQYEDEEEADEEIVAPTEDDGGAGNSQGSSSRKVGSSSSSDPRPIDAQTPDLLHSSGPHDESPASVKEAISPPRLLPFRSSNTNATASTSDSANLPPPLTNRSTPNPFARNNSISANPSSADASAESLSVLIPSSIAGDTNPSSSKSISPLPLQTPLGENGMEIWSEMGEDSYFSGGGVGGGFDWEGTQLEGTNGSSGWLINSS